ncbi:unnamed protein product [Triticum turgidum subsp. durum]|uniref:KIB1-4 beta-propeller domain-containing protein n=1 Tax=Triticum turgidum subsp. durum TaxID=4567 RepID=A0A9R0YZY5_TRITD|nr:unnamed protein product [Triticum turgidum subsp. durum]
MSGTQGWADLPEGLLHSIVARMGLGSAPDLLAFAATCRSWGTAFAGSIATFPPLLLQPDVSSSPFNASPFSNNLVPNRPYLVTDIVKVNHGANLCSEIPLRLEWFSFMGASFGHLILYNKKSCIVVDVSRGVSVSPPQLPLVKCAEPNYGALTAPLTSPNSHLIVEAGPHNLFWRVCSDSWVRCYTRHGHIKQIVVRCSTHHGHIKQIVVFKGRVFGMDSDRRIFKVHLTPQISIQELPVIESSMISKRNLSNAWLVACGDMLLLVGCRGSIVVSGVTFEVFRLDLSFEPALWFKVEKLEHWAIFISTDKRSQALSCMNPEIWGGRSNCIYCYNHESGRWIALELGKPLQGDVFIFMGCDAKVQPMWVVPSMLSLCR